MSSQLLVVFKDSLMGSPSGLQYKITVNDIEIDNNNVSEHNNSLIYHFTTKGDIITISSSSLQKTIPTASEYEIKIFILDKESEKEIGSTILPDGKKVTMVVVSPWTKVPINVNESGDNFPGDFFDVEYEERISSKISFGEKSTVIKSTKIVIRDIPRKIILTALKYRGSTKWAGTKEKNSYHPILKKTYHFGSNTNKCSAFVNDVLLEAGLTVPWIETGYAHYTPQWLYQELRPPLAEEWADPTKLAEQWKYSTTPQPGDVGAYIKKEKGATGHAGIIISSGVTISANSEVIIVNDAGFRNKNGTAITTKFHSENDFNSFRRYRLQDEKK
ncbi:hypothetical protein [Citrobacter freundii]|uniref:hypothetical protein n=1 Tax=Citrobacter freundii TaxID=546 RepID=UPI003A98024F